MKHTNAMSKELKVFFSHSFKLSEGGYYHVPILVFSIGGNGFGVCILGFTVGISWNN